MLSECCKKVLLKWTDWRQLENSMKIYLSLSEELQKSMTDSDLLSFCPIVLIILYLTLSEDHIYVERECVVSEAGLPGHVTELVLRIVISSPPLGVLFVSVNGPKTRNEAKEPCNVHWSDMSDTFPFIKFSGSSSLDKTFVISLKSKFPKWDLSRQCLVEWSRSGFLSFGIFYLQLQFPSRLHAKLALKFDSSAVGEHRSDSETQTQFKQRCQTLSYSGDTHLISLSRRPRGSEQLRLSAAMLAALGGRPRGYTMLQETWSRTPGKQDLRKQSGFIVTTLCLR